MPTGRDLGRVNGFQVRGPQPVFPPPARLSLTILFVCVCEQLLKFLGKGTFGSVYQARREADGKIYAIKKVDTRKMSTKERAEAVNEIRVLASVAGDHVITFYEAFVEQDILYIVTEYAMHGDLLQVLKSKRRAGHLPEALVWSYFLQMCLGIKTMHDNNILHRDLKAANIFMCSPSYLKLGDLGVAKVLKHAQALASTQVGTPYYVAPEVWRNKAYNAKCDMWSLGCLLYELCTFRPPFEAESMEGLARKVMKGRYEAIPNFYSQALRTTLSKLLVVEPNFRSSVNDILASGACFPPSPTREACVHTPLVLASPASVPCPRAVSQRRWWPRWATSRRRLPPIPTTIRPPKALTLSRPSQSPAASTISLKTSRRRATIRRCMVAPRHRCRPPTQALARLPTRCEPTCQTAWLHRRG